MFMCKESWKHKDYRLNYQLFGKILTIFKQKIDYRLIVNIIDSSGHPVLQWEATFRPKSEIHFRLCLLSQSTIIRWKSLSLPPPPLSLLSTKTSPPPLPPPEPKLIWSKKQIRFLICIWMRAWSADIHYRAWLCGLGHKSGFPAVPPGRGLLCANWFFSPPPLYWHKIGI